MFLKDFNFQCQKGSKEVLSRVEAYNISDDRNAGRITATSSSL